MHALIRSRWFVGIAVMATAMSACGGRGTSSNSSTTAEPGITDTTVTIGGIYPFSGPASAYGEVGKGAQAYFASVNAKGGVKMGDGKTRKITFTTHDDSYSPPKAVEAAHQLIEQDKVWAIYGALGTPSNSADWDYINQQKVPDVYLATGASKWGTDTKGHPWTIGLQLAYPTEAAVYGSFVKAKMPNAKVAVLYQNDDYGKDYYEGFKRAVAGSGVTIVNAQTYEVTDPTVDSQMALLSASRADVFFNVTTPKFATLSIKKAADLGWKPAINILNSVSASPAAVFTPAGIQNAEGIYTATTLKDANDPQWASDPAMQDYRRLLVQYSPGANPNDLLYEAGWAYTEAFVKTLQLTKKPTRQGLMDAVRNLHGVTLGLFLPGITLNTSATDSFPVESAQLEQFTGGEFHPTGKILSYEGKTASLVSTP